MSAERVDALLDQFEATLRDVATALLEQKPKLDAIPGHEWTASQQFRLLQIMAKFSEDMGQGLDLAGFLSQFKDHMK